MLSALLRAFSDTESSPTALLVRLEANLSLRPGTFITMFYGILDPNTGRVTYASAGHNPLLVCREGSGELGWYKTRGIPLGAVRGGALANTLQDDSIELGPGDLLVQYTDGIPEAFDISGEHQFGLDRLGATTQRAAPGGCRFVLAAIRSEMERWVGDQPPLDDETLLIVEMNSGAATEPTVSRNAPAEEPFATLEAAKRNGEHIRFTADLDALAALRAWLAKRSELASLGQRDALVLESALYELCANVAEHGYGEDASSTFDLWWLPEHADNLDSLRRTGTGRGTFVLIDRGTPFKPNPEDSVDFDDPLVRRQRRGLGLEIIQTAMRRVSFYPETPVGNITILEFDPAMMRFDQEVSHE
jgi:anti-sigma regulatory factor (Ser/Thr protein kinase)